MTFYTNIFTVLYVFNKEGCNTQHVEPGQVFTINGINGDFYELKPVNGDDYYIQIGPAMLDSAFTKSNYIPEGDK